MSLGGVSDKKAKLAYFEYLNILENLELEKKNSEDLSTPNTSNMNLMSFE